ncbi:MAG: carbohydrate-binding protein, partial [Prolixibacteraceae bacterium]|nr:carbohydrate-binding protein [Prolixibacteraceae bacterium]
VELSQKYGFASAAWDDGGDFRIMEREQHDWNEVKDILIHTTVDAPDPRVDVYQDSIVRVRWANRVLDHDSIIIQRRLGTENHYTDIAVLPPDSILYYDIKPAMSKYYSYRAIANYSDTTDLFSQPFQVFFPTWVKAVRIPFYDTLQVIPGIVEAEDFDKGGEGLSYHDADLLNVGGDYRPDEGVDIYERLGDGYHVGNAINGEWYEYSVNVKTEGWYDVTTYVAALYGGGTFQISVDTVKSDILTALTCYSWLNTKPITTKMYLYTGEQIVRFSVLGDPLFNIDKMIFELTTNVSNLKNQIEFPFTVFQQKNGGLIVKQLSNTNIETIDLYNLSGALFRTFIKPGEVTQIPTYDIPTGIYVIHATSKNGRYSRKIVIK